MTAMTKEQYHAAGRRAREQGYDAAAFKSGTWQEAAYMAGYQGRVLDMTKSPRSRSHLQNNVPNAPPRNTGQSILSAALHITTDGWPAPAREHGRRLIADLTQEKNDRRRLRLITALHRMAKRHGIGGTRPRARALDTPMNTVRCPEGDVTLRDLLAGR